MSQSEQQTEVITSGYMREAELLFPSDTNPYYILSSDIKNIVLLYIPNYFENKATYQWRTDDPKLIKQILTAESGQVFSSKEFEMARLKWKLSIYPNGNDCITVQDKDLSGYLIIHLKLLSLPCNIDTITFSRIFRVLESSSAAGWINTLSNDEFDFWTKKCPFVELKDLNCKTLTIEIDVNIYKIALKKQQQLSKNLSDWSAQIPTHCHVEYQLNKKEINMLVNPDYIALTKVMHGNVYNDMWCIEIVRFDSKFRREYIGVYLRSLYFPNMVKSVKGKLNISCKETDDLVIGEEFIYKGEDMSWGRTKFILVTKLATLQTATFMIDVEIIDVKQKKSKNFREISNELQISALLMNID